MVRTVLFALAALLLTLPPASAQGVSEGTPLRAVTRALAITNARVVVAPGRVLERATVVVRDGRIEAVGPRIAAPGDAEIIRGDSLTVYAGFIDALGYAGVPKPESGGDSYKGDRGDPPRELAGIVPDRDVRDAFDATDARIKQLREAGFTSAHVAPRNGLLSGQGAMVLLRDLGRYERASDLFISGPVTSLARMDRGQGVYPGTPMGVLAALRSSVENARRYQVWSRAYAAGPTSIARPRPDPVADGLAPLLAGERRFLFVVDGSLEAFRALRASEDMELSPILAGLPDVAPLLDRLKNGRNSVIAPLSLPDTVKADSMAAPIPAPPNTRRGLSFVANRRTTSPADLRAERAQLTEMQRDAIRVLEASPGRLAASSVPFAFGTLDTKPGDIQKNLQRMIHAGLAPDAALAALTTDAATLLGFSSTLGTVEIGKLANLVLTDGPLFSDSTAIRYVIVEGRNHEIEVKPKRTPSRSGQNGEDGPQIAGSWDFTVATPDGDQTGTFVFSGSPGSWRGEPGPDGFSPESITVDGNKLSFTVTSPEFGVVLISGTVSGASLVGTAEVSAFGSFPLTATRRPN